MFSNYYKSLRPRPEVQPNTWNKECNVNKFLNKRLCWKYASLFNFMIFWLIFWTSRSDRVTLNIAKAHKHCSHKICINYFNLWKNFYCILRRIGNAYIKDNAGQYLLILMWERVNKIQNFWKFKFLKYDMHFQYTSIKLSKLDSYRFLNSLIWLQNIHAIMREFSADSSHVPHFDKVCRSFFAKGNAGAICL